MNPFYEKRSGKLQIGVSDNMNFPAHLHDDVEVLYCLEGGVQVSVMGETHLVGKGECAVIFRNGCTVIVRRIIAGRCCLFSVRLCPVRMGGLSRNIIRRIRFWKRRYSAGCEAGIQAFMQRGCTEG